MAAEGAIGSSEARAPLSARQSGKLSPGPGLAAQEVAAHQLARIHRATVEIVAEYGYEALRVRDIVRRAEVSTRAFYEHFSSKEDCFGNTYGLIARRSTRRIMDAQVGEASWRRRARLVFEAFAREVESNPKNARVALLETEVAGEPFLEQVWQARQALEGMVAESFARPPTGVAVPPMIVEGMVAGFAGIARARLRAGKISGLSGLGDELIGWALCYPDPAASALAELDRQSVWGDTMVKPLPAPDATAGEWSRQASGDRALILSAVAELTVARGYASLTVPRIRAAAGISRRKFEAHFEGVEDCYLAAVELRAAEALAQAGRAQAAARSRSGGVYRAIAALSEQIAADAFLTTVCLGDGFPPGTGGFRSRRRLIAAIIEQLGGGGDQAARPGRLFTEASASAVWAVFRRHVIGDRIPRRQMAATLSYLVLAPIVGASAAVAAIGSEQQA